MSVTDVISRFGSDLSDDDPDMDVYESLSTATEPSKDALSALASEAADALDLMDDEYVNQEDPYIQNLLGPLARE